MAENQNMTLFIWPEGLFPRRVTFYLRAKNLPSSVDLNIVKCTLNLKTGKFESAEPKPEGTVPVLRIGKDRYIRQASAILEYFEDSFPTGLDMRGSTAEQRAYTRDIINIVSEAVVCFGFFMKNVNPWYNKLSGLEGLHKDTARDALENMRKRLRVLEEWVEQDVVHKGLWLNGSSEGPSIADCTLIAFVEFCRDLYSFDVLEDLKILNVWHEKYRAHPSFEGDPPAPQEMREQASNWEY